MTTFAQRVPAILTRAGRSWSASLFDGDYFMNKADPKHLDAINSGTGCHIDQVIGQSWAFQVGLPASCRRRRRAGPAGRCGVTTSRPMSARIARPTSPAAGMPCPARRAADVHLPACRLGLRASEGQGPGLGGGLLQRVHERFRVPGRRPHDLGRAGAGGLAVTRAVHDRYHASRRNPWNEVECGDHYARSMASYGVFLAACGYEHHGPKGDLGFAPRLTPEKFRCAFTTAQGWGTFGQSQTGASLAAVIDLEWGGLRLQTLTLKPAEGAVPTTVTVKVGERGIPASLAVKDGQAEIRFGEAVELKAGERLAIALGGK